MNIVIPYKPEATNGLELKYALRSIQAHLKGYKDIYLVGDEFPNWLQNVKKITLHEESVKSPGNILKKLLAASKIREVGYPFVRWDDDIYLTEDLHVKDIKYWADGNLGRAIKRHHGSYKTIITNTALKLTEDFPYYDIHAPMIMNRENLLKLIKYDWNRKFLVKSLYAYEAVVNPEPMKDCKIAGPCDNISERVSGNLFFSTGPQGLSSNMIEYLNELYPNKSKYE